MIMNCHAAAEIWRDYVEKAFSCRDRRTPDYQAGWNKVLQSKFPWDTDFVIIPCGHFNPDLRHSRSSYEIAFHHQTLAVVEINSSATLKMSEAREMADNEIRNRLRTIALDMKELPVSGYSTVYAISAFGTRIAVYCMVVSKEGSIKIAVGKPSDDIENLRQEAIRGSKLKRKKSRDPTPSEMWCYDLLTDAGFDALTDIVKMIQNEAANMMKVRSEVYIRQGRINV